MWKDDFLKHRNEGQVPWVVLSSSKKALLNMQSEIVLYSQ